MDGRGEEDGRGGADAGHGEHVGNIVHHAVVFSFECSSSFAGEGNSHVHAGKLTPDLGEDADMGAVDHAGSEKFPVGYISVLAFEVDGFFYFGQFFGDKGRIGITMCMNCHCQLQALCNCVPSINIPRASTFLASSQRSFLASHRGDSGKNMREMERRMAGIICKPHGILNAAVPLRKEVP